MTRIIIGISAVLALSLGPAAAQDIAELEVDHALTFEFETPHTDWARPYALGSTRVLFFTNGRGVAARECVELMQRFEIEAEAVFWARIVDTTRTHWHGGEVGEQRMLRLLDQQWDAYVFLSLGLDKMSPEQQYKVLKPVTEGAGLVFVGSNDERVLKDENRIEDLPPVLARGPVGDAYAVGRGRGIRLPAQPDIPYALGWEVEYDYWAERVGRAILWAAGHEPTMALSVDAGEGQFGWDAPKTFTLEAHGASVGADPVVRMRARKAGGPSVELEERPLPARAFSVRVDSLPGGEYHFDAWVVSDAGVEAWTSTPFTVTADPIVAQVALDRYWGEVGDDISGTVSIEGSPAEHDRLRVGLFDARGRDISHVILNPGQGEAEFSFKIEPWMPMLVRVEAALYRNPPGDAPACTIDSAYEYVHITKRQQDRFHFLIWDTPKGTLAPYAEQSLAENGVSLQLGQAPDPPLYVAANDISWVPYTTRIMTAKTEDGIMQPFCWNDEEAVRAHVQEKAEAYLPARRHGVYVWSLGDEVTTRGSCLSPHCAAAYREYLREVYQSLDALNASWGTEFTDWEQVGLSKEGDDEEANALAERNYPRWFDRQAFKSYNFVQFCRAYDEAYTAIDPLARTGFEGAGRFSGGDDLDLIVRENEFWSPYPGVADEVIRSIAPPDFPRSNWMGYNKDPDPLIRKFWRMITRGMTSVWWWRWDNIGRFHGWIAPDLRPFPAVKELQRDTRIVREGLGDLLMRSEMLDTDIAMLYSYPSQFACQIEDGTTYGSYESSHVAFHEILRDLGYQFRYVTDRMLRQGEFDADRYRVLVLPRIEALGREEARVIRDFVAGGGLVIADVRPAIYDGHCKPLAEGLLDDVFGIETGGRAPAASATATIAGEREFSFDGAQIDPTVTATGGEPAGYADEVPIFIANRYGQGAAVLLNMSAGSYPKLSVEDTPEVAAQIMYELISRDGEHEPPLFLEDAAGQRLRNIEIIRWRDGEIEIMALFRQSGNAEVASVELPEARHVYDMRNSEDLGEVRRFETEVIPSRASFFALTHAPVPTPILSIEPRAAARGTVATASISVPGAEGLHAFWITAKAGETDLPWLSRVVVAGDEAVELPIPLAYNDPAGDYRIVARELFSQRDAVATVQVN